MEPRDAGGGGGGGGGQANSSDFVRKLYKMLEDPSHKDVVRWSATGDSFIVVDTNLFTTKILPQHFKHSNFASFVRQLNKYDFHKIKNTEEGANPQYGEFKHPEFNKNSKDNLDNIRRKAPAARKNQQADDAGSAAIEMLQREIQTLRERADNHEERVRKAEEQQNIALSESHSIHMALTAHASYLKHHEEVLRKLLNIFGTIRTELETLKARTGMQGHEQETSPGEDTHLDPNDESSPNHPQNGSSNSPLADARLLIDTYGNQKHNMQPRNSDQQPFNQVSYNLDGFNDGNMADVNGGMTSVGPSPGQSSYGPIMNEGYNNGGWGQPQNGGGAPMGTRGRQMSMPGRKRSTPNAPDWSVSPRVLLVEDDPTCRRIGSKFLANAQCSVDIADDGLIAVNKMHRNKYDLVLMDIMMPNLDGCSAAHLIRQFDPDTPIIAMTSNIRREDINMYFLKGMNDVLPKPFTKDGLLNLLERMLVHLCKSHKDPPLFPPSNPSNDDGAAGKDPNQQQRFPASSPSPPNPPGGGGGGFYGPGRSPDDRSMTAQSTTPVPVTLDGGEYMQQVNMGGYIDGDGQSAGYQSPVPGQRRRHDDMIGPAGGEHEMYQGIKKQRGY